MAIKDSRRVLMINKNFGIMVRVVDIHGRSMHVLKFMELCDRKVNFTLWQFNEINFRKTVFSCVLEEVKVP